MPCATRSHRTRTGVPLDLGTCNDRRTFSFDPASREFRLAGGRIGAAQARELVASGTVAWAPDPPDDRPPAPAIPASATLGRKLLRVARCRFNDVLRPGQVIESDAAHRWCRGKGLEIGGSACNPFGLDTINVDFTDDMNTSFKRLEIETCGHAKPVDIVAFGDSLPIADGSQDFVVTSHVIEHMPDAIRALLEWHRVVRHGGIVFTIVPHRDRTFDAGAHVTTLAHSLADYAAQVHAAHDPAPKYGRHDHVWATSDFLDLLNCIDALFELGWRIEDVQDPDDKAQNGFTVVIRKRVEPLAS